MGLYLKGFSIGRKIASQIGGGAGGLIFCEVRRRGLTCVFRMLQDLKSKDCSALLKYMYIA